MSDGEADPLTTASSGVTSRTAISLFDEQFVGLDGGVDDDGESSSGAQRTDKDPRKIARKFVFFFYFKILILIFIIFLSV